MFSFKKKDKKDKKEKKQKDKGKQCTQEDLNRLAELEKGLYPGKKSSFRNKDKKEAASVSQSSSDYSVSSMTDKDGSLGSGLNNNDSDRDAKLSRKSSGERKKGLKGILKGKHDGHEASAKSPQEFHGFPHHVYNERLVDGFAEPVVVPKSIPEVEVQPPEPEQSYSQDLPLPAVAPPKPPRARDVKLKRQVNGGFGFTLRRTILEERVIPSGILQKREVHFAEPSTAARDNSTGLLPGDRLVEVNGTNVEATPRNDIIQMIRNSGDAVALKVQPIPELVELSHRSCNDGTEVHLEEQLLKTGNLARSASMRIKKKKAKTDEQLASEKDWLSAEQVWLVHKGGFTAAKLYKTDQPSGLTQDGKVRVKVDHSGEILDVDEDDIEKANPPNYDRIEDLASLVHLNEPSILHTLRQRYGANLIHTYAGRNLLIINPTHQLSVYSDKHATAVVQMFRGCKLEDLPPHIYAVGQSAYRSMQTSRRDQSIVFMGRSGSGKSWNVKHVLQYLSLVATSGHASTNISLEKLMAMLNLMEAFGGAQTIQSSNASRCAQVISLDFDHNGQIVAASLQVLLLEKYRVIRRPDGERNFSIFYYLMEGADAFMSQELFLNKIGHNPYISPLEKQEEKQYASGCWQRVINSCNILGINENDCKTLWSVLAAIIHLGAAGATKAPGGSKGQFINPTGAQKAANLLGTTVEELSRNIFSPKVHGTPTRGLLSVPGLPAEGDSSASEALEGMLVGLYTETINALVSLINKSLSSTNRTSNSIMVVDIPGFQDPVKCGRSGGATFRELCDNYTNERMLALYHDLTFTSQQEKYEQENIAYEFENSDVTPEDIVNLIDRQQGLSRSSNIDIRGADQKGLLWLLDEEAMFPGASDDSFMERLSIHFSDELKKSNGLIRRSTPDHSFILNHLNDTISVKYSTTDWIKYSREHPVVRMAGGTLRESQKKLMSALFVNAAGNLPNTMVGSVAGIEGGTSLKRASSLRRAWTSGTAAIKRKSLCLQIKFQVDGLVDSIRRTNLHFVQCLLPHTTAGLTGLAGGDKAQSAKNYSEGLLDVPLLRNQVRSVALQRAIRIHKYGYPENMLFEEFRISFEFVAPPEAKIHEEKDDKKAVGELMKYLDYIDQTSYKLGLSRIFFRPGSMVQLEDSRDDKLTDIVIKFQAHCRGYLARRKYKSRQVQKLAISCIQKNIRKYLAYRNWPWWRLVSKILPLLDVHRTEEELKMKSMEIEEVRTRLVKVEQERMLLKQNYDKLETKMAEMSADLAEEHNTAISASEMLEAEMAERMRLEKELKEIKASYQNVKRKAEQLEMEVMEGRMMRSSYIDGDMGSSEEEEDSIYKQKYEYLRKELDLNKKKMKQEHEEEMENVISSKKVIERKLNEALEEVEDQRRQVTGLKRKTTKLANETQDIRHNLESQQSRNADLEKKQRKLDSVKRRFDSELHKAQQDASKEKLAKDKLQREKDQLATENYSLKQDLEDLQSEIKIKEERIENQNQELSDLSTSGTKEVVEVTAMKRQKRDMESKIEDLEEELDDQAGQIQQLEQTKLRLEMQLERQKQAHQKELDTKDQEMEDVRTTSQNKLRQLEIQVEEEYRDKQSFQKSKRDLERQLLELKETRVEGNKDTERRLRKDLKRTKILLRDTQMMLDKQQAGAPSHAKLKMLKNELEDSQFAIAAAVKGKQSMEAEVADLQAQIEDLSKSRAEAEERLSHANREKAEIESRLDDHEEDYNELTKKYKALINQNSLDQVKLNDSNEMIAEVRSQKQDLEEKVFELTSRVEFMTDTMVERTQLSRLEAKIKEMESRLDLELTHKQRFEAQLERLKDSQEDSSIDREHLISKEQKAQEMVRRHQREVRELKEEMTEIQRKETEATRKKQELEQEIETYEETHKQLQSDLKLAFKRISDLKMALEDDIMTDSDISGSGSDVDSDDLSSPRYRYSRGSRLSSIDSGGGYTRRRVYSVDSDKSDHSNSGRRGLYSVNAGSSEDETEFGSVSRPNSFYSEDSKETTSVGSSTSSTTTLSMNASGEGEKPPTKTTFSRRGAYERDSESGFKVTLVSKRKGLAVNPDYI